MNTIVHSKEKNGHLHLSLSGKYTSFTAFKIAEMIQNLHNGKGNIFVNTTNVTGVDPYSRKALNLMLGFYSLPKQKVFLKGAKGHELSCNELRVIEPPRMQKLCSCKLCKCMDINEQ